MVTIFSKGRLSDESIWILLFQISNFLSWASLIFIGGVGEGATHWQKDVFLFSSSSEMPQYLSTLLGIFGSEEPSLSLAVAMVTLRIKRES